MKGLILAEFLEMVAKRFSDETKTKVINGTLLASDGVYKNARDYQEDEIFMLLTTLSSETGITKDDLMETYGRFLFQRFTYDYPMFFNNVSSCFDFLQTIENHIHAAVKKMYPDANLPTFKTNLVDPNTLEFVYLSERKMGKMTEGMIKESADYYIEKISIEVVDREAKVGSDIKFIIRRQT